MQKKNNTSVFVAAILLYIVTFFLTEVLVRDGYEIQARLINIVMFAFSYILGGYFAIKE